MGTLRQLPARTRICCAAETPPAALPGNKEATPPVAVTALPITLVAAPKSLTSHAPAGAGSILTGMPGQSFERSALPCETAQSPTCIHKPALSHLKHTALPVSLSPTAGVRRLSLTPLLHLIMSPLAALAPPTTSTVKPAAVTVTLPLPETVEFIALTSSTLGLPSVGERVVTISLAEAAAKCKLETTSVPPPWGRSRMPPPMLPPASALPLRAALKLPFPPKTPPVMRTLPAKLLAPVTIVEPTPD